MILINFGKQLILRFPFAKALLSAGNTIFFPVYLHVSIRCQDDKRKIVDLIFLY